jgi:predicted small lipoprotein YifL
MIRLSMMRVPLALACIAALSAALAACGKKGPPTAPGPQSEIIYPRTYPTH